MTTTTLDPITEEQTKQQPDENHLACCNINPPVSFCGTDITNERSANDDPITCVVCAEFEHKLIVVCPKTGRACYLFD